MPPRTPANHSCPTCGYDLVGLTGAASLVSCPECGSFVRPGSARPQPPARANSRLFLLMIAPMLALTAACWVISILVPDAARGPLYLPLIWSASIILPGTAVALLWPGAVALMVTDPARPLPRPWPSALWLLALATSVNATALWLAGHILHIGPVFS